MSFAPGTVKFKDPEDVRLYEVDWTECCTGGRTIDTSQWTILDPDGITPMLTSSNASILAGNLITQVLLSAGTAGVKYRVENKVTLTGTPTQTIERSFYVRIRDM